MKSAISIFKILGEETLSELIAKEGESDHIKKLGKTNLRKAFPSTKCHSK